VHHEYGRLTLATAGLLYLQGRKLSMTYVITYTIRCTQLDPKKIIFILFMGKVTLSGALRRLHNVDN